MACEKCLLSSVKNIERDVQVKTDKWRELNSAIDAGKKLLDRWLFTQSGVSIEEAFLRAKLQRSETGFGMCLTRFGGPRSCNRSQSSISL